jgi:hypothetical protein
MADAPNDDSELELDDVILSRHIAELYEQAHPDALSNAIYFRELLRLQAELIKLQDWVVHHKEKVSSCLRGATAAGKGGVIKRITSASTRAWSAPWRCPRPRTGNARNGTSSATCRICPQRARSCSSTVLVQPGGRGAGDGLLY